MVDRADVSDVLVVVPGILASRLLHRKRGLVWGGAATATTLLAPTRRLALDGDGLSPDPDVSADGLVRFPKQIPGLWKVDAYTALIDGLHERFVLDASNLIVFAYDWRLSCAANARLLSERIEPVLAARRRYVPDAKLVFVAHSMGGLVVQYFADVLGGASDTKRIITIGTPFRGAAKALGAISGGTPARLPVIRSRVRNLVRTLPSVYELLPRYRAIIDGDTRRAMSAADLPEGADERLFTQACAFHTAIEDARPGTYRRTVVVGSHQRTAQFATVASGCLVIHDSWQVRDGAKLDERGDGTVPIQSVTPPGWHDHGDADPFAQSHIALPGAEEVLGALDWVLSAPPRALQGPQRAMLALEVPDLAEGGTPLAVSVEVPQGDRDVPLIVDVQPLNGQTSPRPCSPALEDGVLVARFEGLAAGDHRVRVSPAVRMPDVRPVWDLVTVINPALGAAD